MQTLPCRVSYKGPHKQPRRTDLVHWLSFQARLQTGDVETTQEVFIENMVNRFGANTSSVIPAIHGVELDPLEEDEPRGDWPYKEAVGSLMRLPTMARPDISNAVRGMARQCQNPTDRHRKAENKIMSYLHETGFQE